MFAEALDDLPIIREPVESLLHPKLPHVFLVLASTSVLYDEVLFEHQVGGRGVRSVDRWLRLCEDSVP